MLLAAASIIISGCAYGQKQNAQPPARQPATNEVPEGKQNENEVNEKAEVAIQNFSFNPMILKIKTGTTVKWTNEDSVGHSVKSDKVNSKILQKDESFEFTFDNAGTYDYICGPHPFMKGKIIVE